MKKNPSKFVEQMLYLDVNISLLFRFPCSFPHHPNEYLIKRENFFENDVNKI